MGPRMTAAEKQQWMEALYEMHPDCRTTGNVSRQQIQEVIDAKGFNWPCFLTKGEARIRRGVFMIPSSFGNSNIAKATPAPIVSNADVIPFKKQDVSSNIESLIPQVDPNYVPFGNYKDVEAIIKSEMFYPVYIAGHSGNGKSAMIEQLCAKHKRPMIRVNMTSMIDEEALIGSKTLVNGNIEVVDGPVIKAMRAGAILLCDEIDAISHQGAFALFQVLEKGQYYFKLNDEMVIAKPGFNVFATANTKGKGSDDGRYLGTNVLSEAFLERFAITMNQEYPSAAIEKKIVMNVMASHDCVDETFADDLVKWSDAIRRTFDDGGIDEIITTRRLIHIVRTYSIFKDRSKAVRLGCNRFDEATTGAFIDLFEKINVPENSSDESAATNDMF